MKIHPREEKMDEAEKFLNDAIGAVMNMGLTSAEYISVLGSTFGTAITRRTKYMIRYERHGNGDTPGGLQKKANELMEGLTEKDDIGDMKGFGQ